MHGSTGGLQQRVDALAKPGAQDGVVKVSHCFVQAFDRVAPGCRTEAEAIVLREDVPHRMSSFFARRDFGQGCLIVAFLCINKALQIMGAFIVRWIATGNLTDTP